MCLIAFLVLAVFMCSSFIILTKQERYLENIKNRNIKNNLFIYYSLGMYLLKQSEILFMVIFEFKNNVIFE